MKTNVTNTLDPTRRSKDTTEFENALRRKIVGQDQAIEKLVEIYQGAPSLAARAAGFMATSVLR
ncbi:MAG TPA: hypothetical protein VFF64_07355 [Candidatus Eremiobacteraceae bacterium]|nr:hypothetical protein [Candidatus Eremiobacteraceae bacterium]